MATPTRTVVVESYIGDGRSREIGRAMLVNGVAVIEGFDQETRERYERVGIPNYR